MMWVDFRIEHFNWLLLFMILRLTIQGENPKKIPTRRELNQVVK